jgi:hypothetical protein
MSDTFILIYSSNGGWEVHDTLWGGGRKLLKSGNHCFSHFYGQVNVSLRLVDQIGWRDGKAVDLQFKGPRFEYR